MASYSACSKNHLGAPNKFPQKSEVLYLREYCKESKADIFFIQEEWKFASFEESWKA